MANEALSCALRGWRTRHTHFARTASFRALVTVADHMLRSGSKDSIFIVFVRQFSDLLQLHEYRNGNVMDLAPRVCAHCGSIATTVARFVPSFCGGGVVLTLKPSQVDAIAWATKVIERMNTFHHWVTYVEHWVTYVVALFFVLQHDSDGQ